MGWARVLARLLAFALLFVWSALFGAATPASAQLRDAPADVTLDANLTIPPLPEGFVRRTAGTLTFEIPASAESAMEPVLATAATEWIRVTSDLGAPVEEPLLVRVGRNPDEMAALAPIEAPPPEYAVGVAYPEVDLVLLTLSAPETWERPDVRHVFIHELAHVALHRAVSDGTIARSLPRWFDEGVAIHEAGERSIERVEVLWRGTVSDQLIPLGALDGFPSRPHAVSLAYAESADFVAWLLRRGENGPEKLRSMLARVRGGDSFDAAMNVTFSASLTQLEDEWRAALSDRYGLAPLLLGSGLAWALVGVLVVLAFRKRRKNTKQTLQRWSEEERIEDERELLRMRAREILRARQKLARTAGAQVADAGGTPGPGEQREAESGETPQEDDEIEAPPRPPPEVPTIEWEGDKHTLH